MNDNIKDIVLAITYRCNARCRMCSIWRETDKVREISKEMVSNLPRGAKDINLSGGEPFLHSDIIGIVRAVVERCPRARIVISTNGFATELILSKMEKIRQIKPDIGVAISIDGLGNRHDEVRGIDGGYEMAMKTVAGLKNLGVGNMRFAFTIGDYNLGELGKVYELSRFLGVELTIAAVHSSDNYFKQKNEIANREKIAEALQDLIRKELETWSPKRWARAYFAHGLKEYLLTGKRLLPDYSGEENIFINPSGEIYPCDIATERMGVLSAEGLRIENGKHRSCQESWMICTARQAIKRHFVRVGMWVLANKAKNLI